MHPKCTCDFMVEESEDRTQKWQEHYDSCSIILRQRKENGEFKNGYPRKDDGTLAITNKHLKCLSEDILYHLALSTSTHDLKKMFGDVKFVCMGGTEHRMESFARYISKSVGVTLNPDEELVNITKASHRYSMFKVGPVLAVNHGIGTPTISVLLQELIKLMTYAEAKDPIFFRIGTSGGIGVKPGTLIISGFTINGLLKRSYDMPILGKMVHMPTSFDMRLAQELRSLATENDDFNAVIGGTMAADDFYRGQGRLDGPFCYHEESEKLEFLHKLDNLGVRNIEMEASAFAAITHHAAIKAADVCVTLLNRLETDQVTTPKAVLLKWEQYPMVLIRRYIEKYMANMEKLNDM